MAAKGKSRKWDPPDTLTDEQAAPDVNARNDSDAPPWENAPATPKSKRAPSKSAKLKKKSTPVFDDDSYDDDDYAAPKSTRGRTQRAAPRDNRLTLTVYVDGGDDEQFDLLCDGRAYWGGYEPPYSFEIKLDKGEHDLRIRQRHALDRQPSRFVPLALSLMLGDGRRGESGPYYAALDAHINISADSKLNVKYALNGRMGHNCGRAAFNCSAGKGLDMEINDTSMSTNPRLRRRWAVANYVTLAAFTVTALTVVALGAYLGVRPGGSVGGGVLIGLIGLALAMCCTGIAGSVREALDGEYAPEIDFPQQKAKKKRQPPQPKGEELPVDAAAESDSGSYENAQDKPVRNKQARSGKRTKKSAPAQNDYDGAYDDAGEMDEFEEAGLSTADLSPEQLKSAKKQLMRKLGGSEEE